MIIRNLISHNVEMVYNALTCVEPVTYCIEISRLRGPNTANNAPVLFENTYLSR
jgi:hypothetical protein